MANGRSDTVGAPTLNPRPARMKTAAGKVRLDKSAEVTPPGVVGTLGAVHGPHSPKLPPAGRVV